MIQLLLAGAVLAACRLHRSPNAVSSVPAPRAIIRATVTGNGAHRQLSAEFTSEEDAYVLVGHASGDGRIHVLFPENAGQTGRISAGTRYQIAAFPADVDADPSLFSLSQPPARSAGAKLDSYDGAGSAFLFVISSRDRLIFDDLAEDDGSWDTYLLTAYWHSNDPRRQIEEFASEISGGKSYRLEFAHSHNTTRFSRLDLRSHSPPCAPLGCGFPWVLAATGIFRE